MTLRIATAVAAIAVAALTSAATAKPFADRASRSSLPQTDAAKADQIKTNNVDTEFRDAAHTDKQDRKNARLRQMIATHAKANGIPVKLADAVVSVESRYNPRARGKAGEVGLMQIKPATARGMGYKGSVKALFDPDTNLRWGMKYLGKAHELGGGSICRTILKYNAGHFAKRMNKTSSQYCNKVKRLMAKS